MTIPTLSKNTDTALRKLDRAIEIFLTIMFASVAFSHAAHAERLVT